MPSKRARGENKKMFEEMKEGLNSDSKEAYINKPLELPLFKLGSLPALSPLKVLGYKEEEAISEKTEKRYIYYIYTLSSLIDNHSKHFRVKFMRTEHDIIRVLMYFKDNPLISVTEKAELDKKGYRQYIIAGAKQ